MADVEESWPELGILLAPMKKAKFISTQKSRFGGSFTPLPLLAGHPTPGIPLCPTCSLPMALIFYIFAPLQGFVDERALHIFACLNSTKSPQCPAEWKIFRQQSSSPPAPCSSATSSTTAPVATSSSSSSSSVSADQVDATVNDWGINDDLGGDDWLAVQEEPKVKDQPIDEWEALVVAADTLASTSKSQGKVATKAKAKVKTKAKTTSFQLDGSGLPVMQIKWETEPASNDKAGIADEHIEQLLAKYNQDLLEDDDDELKSSAGQPDTFEDLTAGANKSIHRFTKRVRRLPSQCLRYCFGGIPLMYTGLESDLNVPDCPVCAAPRTFEMQIMPALIETTPTLDFGTVHIFTCSNSCHQSTGTTSTFTPEFIVHQHAL